MTRTNYSTTATARPASIRLTAGIGAAMLLLGSVLVGPPSHAFADSSGPIPTFRWDVHLDNGVSMAGISTDLPDAIRLAELGETLTPSQAALITQVLTNEAQEENASLTAIAPAVPDTMPAPLSPSADDGGDSD